MPSIPSSTAKHERFATLWDKNLNAQRFAEAFTDKCICG